MSVGYVKDYQGNLILKTKARKIKNELGIQEFFEEGVSCVKMSDGIWYRTTTGKIIYDWSLKKWVYKLDFHGTLGLVEDGSMGHFSNLSDSVPIRFKQDFILKKTRYNPISKEFGEYGFSDKKWNTSYAINEQTAIKHGFQESMYDGLFWKVADCDSEQIKLLSSINIPANERSNTYSLDDDKQYRNILEEEFSNNTLKVEKNLLAFCKKFIPFTFGVEIEIQNGFIRKQLRERLGFRACRDGSLDTGLEYVSIPYDDGKGLQAIKAMCESLSKRTEISNKCSVHVHYGDVRRDKLYVVSFWSLFFKIQQELRTYFPYSRTTSIREDGKIYANILPDLNLKTDKILKSKGDQDFKDSVMSEFNKIYTYLNCGHPLGEKYDEEFVKETKETIIKGVKSLRHCFRVKTSNFTTKLPRHAIQGRKWERTTRYHAVNILNLFFSHSRTIEFRLHEATTNFEKILNMMCLFCALLTYAEKFEKCLGNDKITIKEILKDHFPDKYADYLVSYFEDRRSLFYDVSNKKFKSSYKSIEQDFLTSDKGYKIEPIYNI